MQNVNKHVIHWYGEGIMFMLCLIKNMLFNLLCISL